MAGSYGDDRQQDHRNQERGGDLAAKDQDRAHQRSAGTVEGYTG
jgi:hypothetical protein